jgi:hypothetical protein
MWHDSRLIKRTTSLNIKDIVKGLTMLKKVSVIASVMLLTACSISQKIDPVAIPKEGELCIIKNPEVRDGFLYQYESALSSKGIPYVVVSKNSVPKTCEWTSTYIAHWSWDLALYMSYAEIKVFHKGRLDGQAIYDSTGGGANLNKFIDAETKIRELVDELMHIESASLYFRTFG